MKTQTTIDNITRAQIEALSDESAEAGDLDMVAICVRALIGDGVAMADCARVIQAAEAMDDSDSDGEVGA